MTSLETIEREILEIKAILSDIKREAANGDRWLTTKQVAEELHCHVQTVGLYRKCGLEYRRSGKGFIHRKKDVDAFAARLGKQTPDFLRVIHHA